VCEKPAFSGWQPQGRRPWGWLDPGSKQIAVHRTSHPQAALEAATRSHTPSESEAEGTPKPQYGLTGTLRTASAAPAGFAGSQIGFVFLGPTEAESLITTVPQRTCLISRSGRIGFVSHNRYSHRLPTTGYRLLPFGFVSHKRAGLRGRGLGVRSVTPDPWSLISGPIAFVSHADTSEKLALSVPQSSNRLPTTGYRLPPFGFVSYISWP
jgi:hypothetical protein